MPDLTDDEILERLFVARGFILKFKVAADRHCLGASDDAGRGGGGPGRTVELESAVAPHAIDLAEVLPQVCSDQVLSRCSIGLRRALKHLEDRFRALVESWGWERVVGPGGRDLVEQRLRAFREEVERPYFEAFVSWRQDLSLPADESADREAGRLMDQGYSPVMTSAEADLPHG